MLVEQHQPEAFNYIIVKAAENILPTRIWHSY